MSGIVPPPSAFEARFMHVVDDKPGNTEGGTFTQDAYRTRDLISVVHNTIAGASLASNAISLPAGEYFIMAAAPAYGVDRHRVKLLFATSGLQVLGRSAFAADGSPTGFSYSTVYRRVTLTAADSFTLLHICASTRTTNGFGKALEFSETEYYSEVMVWKIR